MIAMVPVPLSRLQPSRAEEIEDWPWLDQAVLRSSRSRQVCMTCHFFRHHPGPECIPLLTCHLHQGLIAHGEHLTHRCSGWQRTCTASGAGHPRWRERWATQPAAAVAQGGLDQRRPPGAALPANSLGSLEPAAGGHSGRASA